MPSTAPPRPREWHYEGCPRWPSCSATWSLSCTTTPSRAGSSRRREAVQGRCGHLAPCAHTTAIAAGRAWVAIGLALKPAYGVGRWRSHTHRAIRVSPAPSSAPAKSCVMPTICHAWTAAARRAEGTSRRATLTADKAAHGPFSHCRIVTPSVFPGDRTLGNVNPYWRSLRNVGTPPP